jgi:hypothetical protein
VEKAKAWNRANNFGNAELLEFQRYIEDQALKADVYRVRAETSLPLSLKSKKVFFEDPAYVDWMGWDDSNQVIKDQKDKRRRKVVRAVRKLLDKHKIPSHFFGSLFNFVVTGEQIYTYQTKGFPYFTYRRHEDGEWRHECVITPETDLGNPIILENIKEWQKRCKSEPPKPIKIGRRKDWRPVWEWRNRNPDIPDHEIARMLKLNRVTVSRALAQLDKKYATK